MSGLPTNIAIIDGPIVAPAMALDRPRLPLLFSWSRDIGRGAQPKLEGAYALRQWVPSGNEIHAALRLSQAT
jgi:hypothetical protein